MALYAYTRIQLRHDTARLCNDLIKGIVASPTSGSFVCTGRDFQKPDDFFNNHIELFCYQGTGIGTSAKPDAWVSSTHTLSFTPVATLTAGDLVELHERFSVDTYNQFINMAIELVSKEALLNKVDTSITLVAGTYSYSLPTQFLYVHRVEMESATADVYDTEKPIDPKYWRVIKGTTTTIEFVKNLWTPTDARKIRITGLASPSILDTDTEECPLNPVYVVYQAAALLHQSLIRSSELDPEYHSEQMKLNQTMADKVRATMRIGLGGAKPVTEA
jgi:hypothetical protein